MIKYRICVVATNGFTLTRSKSLQSYFLCVKRQAKNVFLKDVERRAGGEFLSARVVFLCKMAVKYSGVSIQNKASFLLGAVCDCDKRQIIYFLFLPLENLSFAKQSLQSSQSFCQK